MVPMPEHLLAHECAMIIVTFVSPMLAPAICQQTPRSWPHFGQHHATQSPLTLWEVSPSLPGHLGTSS